LEEAEGYRLEHADNWIHVLTAKRERADRLERQLLDVLAAAEFAGSRYGSAAERALSAFLGIADTSLRIHKIASRSASDEGGGFLFTEEDLTILEREARGVVGRIVDAIAQLEVIAPREPHEPPIPNPNKLLPRQDTPPALGQG
jgi:hypothetical protein